MLMDQQSELMSDLLFTVHQHGGDDVTWKPPIREFLKIPHARRLTTTKTSHGKAREFTFFKFLSWFFQPAYFVKASELFWSWISINISKFMKRMNFVTASLRPSPNMKLGIFTGSRAVDGKECTKKCDARAKLLFCLVKPLLVWLPRRRRIFIFLLFTILCDESKTEYSRGKLNCSRW